MRRLLPLLFSTAGLFACLFVVSCDKTGLDDIDSPDKSSFVRKTNPDSTEIALMEREQGFEFFKRDITLKDESNRNTVVIRLAASNKEAMDEYLATYKLGLKIMPSQGKSAPQKANNNSAPVSNQEIKSDLDETKASPVYLEEIYSSLESAKTNYLINFEVNDRPKNARSWASPYDGQLSILISTDWPEELVVTKTKDEINNTIGNPKLQPIFEFKLELKAGSPFSSYYDPCCLYKISPSNATIPDNFLSSIDMSVGVTLKFDIDGPKRARTSVRYIDAGSYSVGYSNW